MEQPIHLIGNRGRVVGLRCHRLSGHGVLFRQMLGSHRQLLSTLQSGRVLAKDKSEKSQQAAGKEG